MAELIGIGLVIVVAVALLRAFSGSPQPSKPPQIIYVQAVPQQKPDESGGGAGAPFFLIVAVIAAISFFPG